MAASKKPKQFQRVFKTDKKIMHDLYKLEVAEFQKNIAMDGEMPRYEPTAHCHYFHTVDKNGSPQTKCSPIASHFHIMEKTEEGVYKCSGPKKMLLDPRTKKRFIADLPGDTHTHDTTYMGSEEFKRSKLNAEAVKLIGEIDKAPQPIPGIVG